MSTAAFLVSSFVQIKIKNLFWAYRHGFGITQSRVFFYSTWLAFSSVMFVLTYHYSSHYFVLLWVASKSYNCMFSILYCIDLSYSIIVTLWSTSKPGGGVSTPTRFPHHELLRTHTAVSEPCACISSVAGRHYCLIDRPSCRGAPSFGDLFNIPHR